MNESELSAYFLLIEYCINVNENIKKDKSNTVISGELVNKLNNQRKKPPVNITDIGFITYKALITPANELQESFKLLFTDQMLSYLNEYHI